MQRNTMNPTTWVTALSAGVLSMCLASPALSAEQISSARAERQEVAPPVTEGFADTAAVPAAPEQPRPDREYWLKQTNVEEEFRWPDGPSVPDPNPVTPLRPAEAGQDRAPTAFSYFPRTTHSFSGITRDGSPADPILAAGPDHLVAMVNTEIAVFSKDGVNQFQQNLDTFFAGTGFFSFDPKVVYDPSSQRFIAIAISKNDTTRQSFWHVAVSTTSNPLDSWHKYGPIRNDVDDEWIDYPGLGVGARGIYLTGNWLDFPDSTATGNRTRGLWVLPKDDLVNGRGFVFWRFVDLAGSAATPGTLMPTLTYGTPPGGVDAFVTTWESAVAGEITHLVYGADLPPTFPTDGPSLTIRAPLTMAFPGGVPNVDQAGGPAEVQANNLGSPPMNAIYRNGRVWAVYHWGPNPIRVQYYSFNVGAWPATPTVVESPTYTLADRDMFWPQIAVNDRNDVGIGVASGGEPRFIGAGWLLNEVGGGTYYNDHKLGEDYYGRSTDNATTLYRWGDYSGAAVDPVGEGFWFFNKYAETRSGGNPIWGSWLAYVTRAVFVDHAYVGVELGTRDQPRNSIVDGVVVARPTNDLVVKAGNYPGFVNINKALEIIPDGGPVTIGQ